jgi:hypothetical protein
LLSTTKKNFEKKNLPLKKLLALKNYFHKKNIFAKTILHQNKNLYLRKLFH